MHVATKAAVWFVFCNLMQKGISTITVPIFTRLLTTSEYGTYSLYLSWFNIFTIVTSLNLYYGPFNNALNKYRDAERRARYISSMQGITVSITAVLAVIYLVAPNFWSDVLGLNQYILALMLLELLVEPALHFWQGRQRFEYHYKKMVIVTLLKSLCNPLLGLCLVLLTTGDKANARITSVVFVELIIAGTIMVQQFIRGKVFYSKEDWKYALSFNIPLIPHYLSGTVLNQGDRIMIQHIVGRAEVGIYSVAYSIGMLIQLFTNAINNSMTPWMYENLNEKNYSNIRKNITLILSLLAGIIICMLFFVPELVAIFASEEYYNAIYVVPPVACSVYFVFLYNIFAIPQMYFERQYFMSVASILAAALNVGLNAIFIPIYGYYAAGYTTVACYILYSIGHCYFSYKVCMDKIQTFSLFDTRAILGISLGVFVCSILFNLLYKLFVIRYVIAAVVVFFGLAQRKRIIGVLREVKRKRR